jgi:hypothetical protein
LRGASGDEIRICLTEIGQRGTVVEQFVGA